MTLGSLLLGFINIAIVVAVLILVGLVIEWFLTVMKFPPPDQLRRVYLIIVALIGLYMIVALLLGLPSVRLIGSLGALPAPT